MRITRPVRSSKCTHIQCFDANWWIESNAQHPQWLCPLCSKELKFDDLIVDGCVHSYQGRSPLTRRSFFLDILNTVPDSFDEVVIESNSDWHTEDKKYGAASWLATHQSAPVSNGAVPNGTHHSPTPQAAKPAPKLSPDSPDRKGKRKAIEILSSDEDEDVDVPLSRVNGHTSSSHTASSSHQASLPPPRPPARAPSASSARQQSQQPATTGSGGRIIDLTLDSSDDDEDELEDAYFRQPDVESTSRAADDSTRARHDVGQEVDARQDGFGGGLAGGLGGGGVARGIGTGEVGGDRYGPGGGDRFRSGTGGRDGGEEGGGVPHHWDAWGAEWDEEDDGMRFGQRKRSRASDWMDEEYRD